MSLFRAGLVGAGDICEHHVAALRRLPGVEVAGLCDADASKAVLAGERLRVPVFPSLTGLKEAGANVIHVLTPPDTHTSVTLAALALGCHVLVDRPLAVDADDCDLIARAAAARNLQVCVNHSLLFDPQVQRALAAVRAGRLGQIVSVDILRSSVYPPWPGGTLPPQYRAAGCPFRDLGVHALYLMEALLGPIERVSAHWRSLGGDPNLAYDEWRATVLCRDGMGQFQLSWNAQPLQHQITIQGTRGMLHADLISRFQERRPAMLLPQPAESAAAAFAGRIPSVSGTARAAWDAVQNRLSPHAGLQQLVAAFYQALETRTPVPVPASETRNVVRWTESIGRLADHTHAVAVSRHRLSGHIPVLVTGASGNLGRAIVERLRAEGCPVRILVRRLPGKLTPGVEAALGDLGDPEAVERAVRGAQTVIHAGAAMKGDWTEHQRGTITGTLNVLRACCKHGVTKLVHISSLNVADWAGGEPGSALSESTPYEPYPEKRGEYTRAKLEAERLVLQFVRDFQLPAVILRPGQIFGGPVPVLTSAVARRLGRRWVVLGNGEQPLPLVCRDDVVDAVLMARESPLRHGEIFHIVDSGLTQNEVLARVLGPEARVWHVPRFAIMALGKISEILMGVFGRISPYNLHRLRAALASHTFPYSNAQSKLGWIPHVGVQEGLRLQTAPRPMPPAAPVAAESDTSRQKG